MQWWLYHIPWNISNQISYSDRKNHRKQRKKQSGKVPNTKTGPSTGMVKKTEMVTFLKFFIHLLRHTCHVFSYSHSMFIPFCLQFFFKLFINCPVTSISDVCVCGQCFLHWLLHCWEVVAPQNLPPLSFPNKLWPPFLCIESPSWTSWLKYFTIW